MNLRLSVFVFILVFSTLQATTYINSSTVSGEWTLSGSPYYVMNDISIPEGQTLSIMPGVRVFTEGLYAINVNGTLRAIGTAADSIYFTAADTTAGWHGLHFNQVTSEPDSSYITHCHISYGKTHSSGNLGYGYREGGGIYMKFRNKVVISHSTITKCSASLQGGGIYSSRGSLILYNSVVTNNVSYGGGGIYTNLASQVVVKHTVILNNLALSTTGGGLYLDCAISSESKINNCLISNNTASINGGGISLGAGRHFITNCTISYNNSTRVGSHGALSSSTLPINKQIVNCILFNNSTGSSGTQGITYYTDFKYCSIANGTIGGTDNTQSNIISEDPLFISPPAGMGANYNGVSANFGLLYNSPCIDAGDPMLLDADGTRSDIGYRPYLHKAWFQATPLFLTVGDVVNLQNLSQGYDIPEALIEWDISADGAIESNSYNWSYQFNSPGVYPIKLIQSAGALRDSCYQTVVVQQNQLPAPDNVIVNVIDSEVVLSWNPVTETVDNNPVDVNYYVVYSCDRPDGYFRYLGTSEYGSPQFVHTGASSLSKCFYIVIGFDGSERDLQEFISKQPVMQATQRLVH